MQIVWSFNNNSKFFVKLYDEKGKTHDEIKSIVERQEEEFLI